MKLNKKGYMLVEIIVASVIAFGVGYFILQMVINLKNKNDDLLVETLMSTDQTIIMNKLMEYAKNEGDEFSCEKLTKTSNALKYDGEVIDVVNDYATIGDISCNYVDNTLFVSVPLRVKQFNDRNYDVKLDYNPSGAGVSDIEITDEEIENSALYTIIFDCGDNAYWDRPADSNVLNVSYDYEFEVLPTVCVSTLSTLSRRHVTWKVGGRQYNSGSKVSYSYLLEQNILSQSEIDNKRAIFSAIWNVT